MHTPMPDIAYTEQIKLNSKSNSTANQTLREHRKKHREHIETEVFILKKKKNLQYTNKNQTPANPRSRRRDAAARSSSPSSLAPHRRSEIGLCSGAPSGPPSRYFSLFLSLFISLSRKWKMKRNFCRSSAPDGRSVITHRRSAVDSLLPPLRLRLRPSLKVFLSDSLSLSLYLIEWPNGLVELKSAWALSPFILLTLIANVKSFIGWSLPFFYFSVCLYLMHWLIFTFFCFFFSLSLSYPVTPFHWSMVSV